MNTSNLLRKIASLSDSTDRVDIRVFLMKIHLLALSDTSGSHDRFARMIMTMESRRELSRQKQRTTLFKV